MAIQILSRGKGGTFEMNKRFAQCQPKSGNTFTVASLPDATQNDGRIVFVSNGAAGAACAAISNGTNWKVIALGATVSAS